MKFKLYYLIWFIILFFIELYIAIHVRDNFIRPYLGDVLVVILIYSMVRAFFPLPILPTALGVLLFAFGVEILQYFKIVEVLGLGDSSLARTVIGTTFVWEDLVAYTAGTLILLYCEKAVGRYKREWRSVKSFRQ